MLLSPPNDVKVTMNIQLPKVLKHELKELHEIQVCAFKALMEKYQDFETNPAVESLQKLEKRYAQPSGIYHFIRLKGKNIGAIRVIRSELQHIIRISPMFIHPDYQNLHLGQEAVLQLERLYNDVKQWSLDTILQERKLCHFYERLGYTDTGKRENIKDGMDLIFYEKSLF